MGDRGPILPLKTGVGEEGASVHLPAGGPLDPAHLPGAASTSYPPTPHLRGGPAGQSSSSGARWVQAHSPASETSGRRESGGLLPGEGSRGS